MDAQFIETCVFNRLDDEASKPPVAPSIHHSQSAKASNAAGCGSTVLTFKVCK